MRLDIHTETTRAEVARAKPAILVASTHFWAKSLRSAWREQVTLEPAPHSSPKALDTFCDDLSCKLLLPTLVGCMRVAAACREAAIFFCLFFFLLSLSVEFVGEEEKGLQISKLVDEGGADKLIRWTWFG